MAKSNKSKQMELTPEQAADAKLEKQKAKSTKFREIANRRVANAVKAIDLVGNLSNRSQYHYDENQVAMIESMLDEKVKEVISKFNTNTVEGGKPTIDLGTAI